MAAAPPPPRRLIRQNAVVNHGNFPPAPPMQALLRQQALGIPNNIPNNVAVPVTTIKPKAPRRNLPRTEKERRSTRRRRISTRRRAY